MAVIRQTTAPLSTLKNQVLRLSLNKDRPISTNLVAMAFIALTAFAGLKGQPAIAKSSELAVVRKIQSNLTVKQEKQPDFDKEVLEPLKAVQAEIRRKEEEARLAEERRLAWVNSIANRVAPYGSFLNGYAWGNCTRYVASRIRVPEMLGNAKSWGYILGTKPEPVKGAIAWTTAGWAGHVAIVESVQGDTVTVSEMNYAGFNRISWRTVPKWEFAYIY